MSRAVSALGLLVAVLALACPAQAAVRPVIVDADPAAITAAGALRVAVVGSPVTHVRVSVRLSVGTAGLTLRARHRVLARPIPATTSISLTSAARALLARCEPVQLTARLSVRGAAAQTAVAEGSSSAPPCVAPVSSRPEPAAATSPGTPGIAVSGGFVDQPRDDIDHDLALIAATGVHWLRLALDWGRVQPEPAITDWSRFDAVAGLAAAHGIRVLLVPSYAPPWACRTGGTSPRSRVEFADFVGRAVAHFRPLGIRNWEIWNEPNLRRFWGPQVSPLRYGELLRTSAAMVKAVDPGARVLAGGLARTLTGGGSMAAPLFLDRLLAHGGLGVVDAVAVHPYSYPSLPSAADDDGNAWPDLTSRADSVDAQLRRHRLQRVAIWVTELGAPTAGTGSVTEAEQAAILTDGYALARRSPSLGPVFWYSNRDLPPMADDPERAFGLWRHDFTAKPAVAALAAAVAAAAGR